MNSTHNDPERTSHGRARMVAYRAGSLLACSLAVLAASCSGGGSSSSLVPGGQVLVKGDGLYFVSDDHFSGNASSLRISSVLSGRLVDIFDEAPDPNSPGKLVRTKRFDEFLIGQEITSNGLEYELTANPVTGEQSLTILAPIKSAAFKQALKNAVENLTPVLSKGLTGSSALPPFTAVPRNGAIALQFNDLLDASTISGQTVLIQTGNPPSVPYEARILADPSHGGLLGTKFYTSRVILDFTVSTFESQQTGGSLPVNTLGLPPAVVTNQPNAVVRVPTSKPPGFGQFELLTNVSGHTVSFTDNGPVDGQSSTLDVLRSFRSQGATSITGDPNNGFLPDSLAPSILGSQAITVTLLNKDPGTQDEFLIDLLFDTPTCALPARVGDVLQMPNNLALVIAPGTLVGAALSGVRVQLISGIEAQFVPSQGQFRSAWDPAVGAPTSCFVRFNPLPGSAPNAGITTAASVIVAFSEPMDPTSVLALDTFTVAYETPPNPNPMWANVVGKILPSADLREFRFQPSVPLRHTQGSTEKYFVDIVGDDPNTGTPTAPVIEGITDLAGNALTFDLTDIYGNAQNQVEFTLEATQVTRDSAGIGFKFATLDEDGNGTPELRGQFLHDPNRQVIKPRSVSRFSVVVDPNQPLIGAMPITTAGLQTPLSNLGSKMQSLWRYIDLGFTLLDDNTHNLDVEALFWSPFTPAVQPDNFPQFQITLAHALPLPDEVTNTGLLPSFRFSGMLPDYSLNLLDPDPQGVDPQTVVAPKASGYFIDPQLSAVAPTGTRLFPWPINLNIPLNKYIYWTWRDTAKTKLGGRTGGGSGPGADPQRLLQITGTGMVGFYPTGNLPTIALPLLTEYRCYPDPSSFGLNGFATSFALNSSYKPCFRAFSTGGVSGTTITTIDPDNDPVAQGGINPGTGQQTSPIDNAVYWGQADFVVRVSRMHTIWLDTTAAHQFADPVIEPSNNVQPSGTLITLAFRGATSVTAPSGTPWLDAINYDPYGNTYTASQLGMLYPTGGPPPPPLITVTFLPSAGASWKSSLADINNARYLQARVSFLSNAESDLSPELSSLGFGFIK